MLTDASCSSCDPVAVVPSAPAGRLDDATFATVISATPLVSIDLIVENLQGEALLGLRSNPPAQHCWFVPGGRIRKNETLAAAFCRLTRNELGCDRHLGQARFQGVYEHFYNNDFSGKAGATTHYVVLAYRLQIDPEALNLPTEQHAQYAWMRPEQIASHPQVHVNTQAYFLS